MVGPAGGDTDISSSDVRWRIQQDSYVQDQYVLTCCSLSSERTYSTPSHQAESSVLGMGSLPHGLEKIEPPQGRGLSRWESPWAQNATCSGETTYGKVIRVVDLLRSTHFSFKNLLFLKKMYMYSAVLGISKHG